MRLCGNCFEEKAEDQFRKGSKKKDIWCNACIYAAAQQGKAEVKEQEADFWGEVDRERNKRMDEPLDTEEGRFCFTCCTRKPKTEFHKVRYGYRGFNLECKECSKIRDSTSAPNADDVQIANKYRTLDIWHIDIKFRIRRTATDPIPVCPVCGGTSLRAPFPCTACTVAKIAEKKSNRLQICTTCSEEKSIYEFYKDMKICKDCHKEDVWKRKHGRDRIYTPKKD